MTDPTIYPPFQQLADARTRPHELPGKYGLIWPLTGPLTSISIKIGDSPPVPYCTAATSPDTALQYHAISLLPLTSPKTSSIIVKIYELEEWEDDWYLQHSDHFSPNDIPNEIFEFRSMPDWSDDDEDDDRGDLKLVKCCGEMRPRDKKASLVITPVEDGEGYLTVRDYVDAVYPWLMGMLPKLREAVGEQNGFVVSEEAQLSINCNALDSLMIDTELNMDPVQGLEESEWPVKNGRKGTWATIEELQASLREEYGDDSIILTTPY